MSKHALSSRISSGRNISQAILVGLAMGIVALVPLVWYKPAFMVLVAIGVGVAIWELAGALRYKEVAIPVAPLIIGGAGTIVLVWFTGAQAILLGIALTIVAAIVWRLTDGPANFGRDITAAVFVTCYVPLLACFVILMLLADDGTQRVIAFAGTTICSDIGGFVVGSLFGRHKSVPAVSPHKTWEGFAGSVGLCMVVGVFFLIYLLDNSWWEGVLFGFGVAVAAILGDLAESLLKRDLGVKDMSSVLPAHGGVMDRFDSLLIAAPVAYALLTLFTA